MEIQRNTSVSDQIVNIFLKRISGGIYHPGERIPSETELCAEFGVSRATVRTAISALTARGLLVRKIGIGTFLSYPQRLETGLEQLESVVSMARRQGSDTRIIDLTVTEVAATRLLSENLSVAEGTPLTAIRRTILVDQEAASYHEDYVLASELHAAQVDEHFQGSVLDLLVLKHTPRIRDAVTEITALNARQGLSTRLGVPLHSALILLKEKTYDDAGKVVSYSENYFVPDRFYLRVIRNKIPQISEGG
ncbi:MAG TPA: GntR family transcriptional regulator [Anaerolineaceae bacterium]|nr:GntR family transcriptional regulator [Anaerolineaceae bacterium]